MTSKKMLMFGFGYTASFLQKKLKDLGFDVIGTSRHQDNIDDHDTRRQKGSYELILFDAVHHTKHLDTVTHVLISAPPVAMLGDPVLHAYHELLKKHAHHIQWLGYLSSTGVYGDHQGKWVDESSPSVSPGTQGRLRRDAEKAWVSFAKTCDLPLHIFRLAGIYGPQRNALSRLKRGKKQTIYKKDQFFSRIHVEDIAAIIIASVQKIHPFSIYNVSDDEPAPSHVVDDYAASLMHRPPLERVPFLKATLSPMGKDFYTHNRRVSNAKIKQELCIKLKYPTYKEGLKKIHDNGDY